MPVLGLGDRQKRERLLTDSKIVSFLRVSPFTYEQLWRVSRIHRNTLKLRLQHLVDTKIVIKHRYSIPYEYRFYGHMYKHPVPYRPPIYNHDYYLLNYSQPEIKNFLSVYLIRKEVNWSEDRKKGNVKPQNQPSFQPILSLYAEHEKEPELYRKKITISSNELKESYRRSVEMIVYFFRYLREYDLAAVKERVNLLDSPMTERGVIQLKKIAEFFKNNGYSVFDILVRCSTEHTEIPGDRYFSGNLSDLLSLEMTNYAALWNTMEKIGLLKN